MLDVMICIRCGRLGTRGFVISSGTGDGRDTYACANSAACDRRQARYERRQSDGRNRDTALGQQTRGT